MNEKQKGAIALLLITAAAFLPIWTIKMNAPLYAQKWLAVDIYIYKAVGDIKEVNIINHYVGLREVDPNEMPELKFGPYLFAALIIAVLGALTVRKEIAWALLLLAVVATPVYFQAWIYNYGHDIAPGAALKIEPFTTPVMTFGVHTIAVFKIVTYFNAGYWLIVLAAVLTTPKNISERIKNAVRRTPKQ